MKCSVRKVNSFIFLHCIEYKAKDIIDFPIIHNRK